MFGAIAALAAAAIGAGVSAANASAAKKRAREERDRSYEEYSRLYNTQLERSRQATEEAAMRQQMVLANQPGQSAAAKAAGIRNAQMRAPQSAATASLAAHEMAQGYAQGSQQHRQANANIWGTYNNAADMYQQRLTGMLSQVPQAVVGMAQGVGGAINQSQSQLQPEATSPYTPTYLPGSYGGGQPAAPSTAQTAPSGGYPLSPSASVQPGLMDDSYFELSEGISANPNQMRDEDFQ